MVSATQGDRELIADLAAEGRRLRKSQVVGFDRSPPADQAGQLGDRFDVVPIADPPRRRQCQHGLVDSRPSPFVSLRQSMVSILWFIYRFTRKDHQPGLEGFFDREGISVNKCIFLTESTMSPTCGLIS